MGKGVFQRIQSISPPPHTLRTHEISVLTFGETKLYFRGFVDVAEQIFEERDEGRPETKKGDGAVVMKGKYVPSLAKGSKMKGKLQI